MEEIGCVLVVSDDRDLAAEIEASLPPGTTVLSAPDARAAMALLRNATPSAAVVAIRTGSAGGFSLAREMSQGAGSRAVPIVMLLEREQDRWLAESAGARAMLALPAAPFEIVREVLALVAEEPVSLA